MNKETFVENASVFAQDLVVGSIASVTKTILAPLERIKILLQVQLISKQLGKEEQYKGATDALRKTIATQGFFSMWKGNLINIIRYYPSQGLNFAFRGAYQKMVPQPKSESMVALRNFMCGGAAGATSLLFVYPLDLIRTRITADIGKSGPSNYKNILDCIKVTYQTEGKFWAFYKGFSVSLLGIMINRGMYFGGYDNLKHFLLTPESNQIQYFAVAQVSTLAASILGYPFDTTRHHMHLRGGGNDRLYNSSLDCASKIYYRYGLKGFYNGFSLSMYRSVGSALSLVLFDYITSSSFLPHSRSALKQSEQ